MNNYKLTKRELQVLDLIVQGFTAKDIGKLLKISYRTVDVHRLRMMRKIGASNTASAVRIAILEKFPINAMNYEPPETDREQFEESLKKAVGYGIGYVCGKHNLNMSKKEMNGAFKSFKNWIEGKPEPTDILSKYLP